MTIRLTNRTVEAIKPTAKAAVVYDSSLKGFGVRVAPSGNLSWFVEYRPGAGGRRVAKRRMVIGSRELTPEQARGAAKAILAKVSLGQDPASDRQSEREMATFREFAERYLAEEAASKLKPGTIANYRIAVRKHAAPKIGTIRIDAITTNDISRLHQAIGATKPMTANRVVECISSIFRYAATCGIVEIHCNPTKGIRAFREKRRERFLSDAELARLGEAIREGETVGIPYLVDESNPKAKHAPKIGNRRTFLDPYSAAALRLLLLTGARLREILNLRWEYVDLQRGLLLLPDSKTGRKSIILNPPSMTILTGLDRRGDFVIVGESTERPRADLNRPWRAVSRRAGLLGVRLHDLRHTHASIGAGAGFGLHIIGKLLGHSQPSTTARYAHLADDPLRRASDSIGTTLAIALGEPPAKELCGMRKKTKRASGS